jgi:MFS transporter, DHA1 family, inner membrane transport protein
MPTISTTRSRTPLALYALTAGAFGIGTTEFVIMGLARRPAAITCAESAL